MPPKAKRPCRSPMCPGKTQDSNGFCEKHAHLASGWNAPGRQSAAARGYGGEWRRLRARVLVRDRHLCQCENCLGKRLSASEVDHIVPKHLGGTDDFANLCAINSDCHKEKTQRESLASRLRT